MAIREMVDVVEAIEHGAPHVIRNEEQLEEYTDRLFSLTALEDPSPAEVEAIDLLSLLIERYEKEAYPLPKASPVDVLKFLMEHHGLTQSKLGEELGSQSLVSLILRGRRQLTPAHMRALGKRFNVSPAVFL